MNSDDLSVKHQLAKAAIEHMLKVDEAFELAESERVSSSVSGQTHALLHGRVFAYYRAVKRCLDMYPNAEELWKDRDIGRFERMRSQKQEIVKTIPGRGQANTTTLRTAPLDYETLDTLSDELDDVTSHLAESTHRTEIDDELIEEVEEWRQQNLEA